MTVLNPDYEHAMSYGYGDMEDYTKPAVAATYAPDGKGGWVKTGVQELIETAEKKYCTHSNDFAWVTSNANITFHGSTGFFANPAGFDFAIDLGRGTPLEKEGAIHLSDRTATGLIGGPMGFMEANHKLLKTPIYLDIVWPDYDIMSFAGWEFWNVIAKELMKTPDTHVLVACMGGHGRTGSCIAILAGMIDDLQGAEVIPEVRRVYCKKAIETPAQEDYVIDVLSGKF